MRNGIYLILKTGVIVSALLIITGGILFAIQHPGEVYSYKNFAGQPERLRNIETIIMEALQLRSRSVIQLGILVMIATPVVRVIFSFSHFILRREWTYVIITFILMATLFYSLFG